MIEEPLYGLCAFRDTTVSHCPRPARKLLLSICVIRTRCLRILVTFRTNPGPGEKKDAPVPRAGGYCWQMPYAHRGTLLIRNSALLGPYSRTMHETLRWSWGGELFLMSEVPLYAVLAP